MIVGTGTIDITNLFSLVLNSIHDKHIKTYWHSEPLLVKLSRIIWPFFGFLGIEEKTKTQVFIWRNGSQIWRVDCVQDDDDYDIILEIRIRIWDRILEYDLAIQCDNENKNYLYPFMQTLNQKAESQSLS
ncbi:MAG: hypothetical protein PHW50_00510 [Patescibacteria group bacterium]|nr:hypothetical protein [Patescibacteria group bacterium]